MPRPCLRRDEVRVGEREERELALEVALDLVALIGVEAVPLVDADDERATRLEDVCRRGARPAR